MAMLPAFVLSLIGVFKDAGKGYAIGGLILGTSPLWAEALSSVGSCF